jgi:hypothetical protein
VPISARQVGPIASAVCVLNVAIAAVARATARLRGVSSEPPIRRDPRNSALPYVDPVEARKRLEALIAPLDHVTETHTPIDVANGTVRPGVLLDIRAVLGE